MPCLITTRSAIEQTTRKNQQKSKNKKFLERQKLNILIYKHLVTTNWRKEQRKLKKLRNP